MNKKPAAKLFSIVLLAGVVFLLIGAPGISKSPAERAYDRCMQAQEDNFAKLKNMGLPSFGMENLSKSSCEIIRSTCDSAPDGLLCQSYLNAPVEAFR